MTDGKILTKADILAADDLRKQRLSVPEWGGDVYVRIMTGFERDGYEEWAMKSGKELRGLRARIASLCLVDADGKRLFDDNEMEAVGNKSAAALERVVEAVMKLNAITADDLEDLKKNSQEAPSGSSSST